MSGKRNKDHPFLFDVEPVLPCWFGSPWLDHFSPPIGTGKGCQKCDAWQAECVAREKEKP